MQYFDLTKFNASTGSPLGSQQSLAERKMSAFETYIALIKGYCVLLVLILPKSFANGGFLASGFLLVLSGFFSAASACLLAEAGLKEKIYSYPLLVLKAFGPTGKFAMDIMISLAQYSFTISHIAFIIESLKSTIDSSFDIKSNYLAYVILVLAILPPVAWVNNIAKFAFTYMLGNLLIFLTVITVCVYCVSTLL